jgi:2-(1,2-epoxy-1,2-dihydrophenyl)acetyl-CoA isomerase
MSASVDSRYETILYDVVDGVATLTMNRPERRNAMTNQMVAETYAALTIASTDPALRVLVLTGAGSSFCPGADLQWVAGGSSGDDRLSVDQFRIPALLHDMPAVTIAAVNGACAGAAMGWACACDLRIAASTARFNTAFLDVGVAGDMALPWSLSRLLGASKARELMFLPDKFDAAEAHRIGLVARVVHDEEEVGAFSEAVGQLVTRLTAASPAALRTLKQNFLDAEHQELGDFAVVEAERHIGLFALDDTREAFAAKVEKRAPRFTGR